MIELLSTRILNIVVENHDFTISLIFFQVLIMVVGDTLRDFCKNTSVHGLAFVVESKSSVLKRLAWMTIFLMCLTYAIMQIKESIDGRIINIALHTYIIKTHRTFTHKSEAFT